MDVYISHPNGQDKEDIVDPDIVKLISLIKEDREKHPLPEDFFNHFSTGDGNCMLRFEDIGMVAAETWNIFPLFVPKGLRDYVQCSFIYSSGSKTCGFVAFCCHEIAKKFLKEFNGLEIPRANLSYKLSWAPFSSNYESDCMYLDEQINEVAEEKQFDVPTANSEINEKVDVLAKFDSAEKRQMQLPELVDTFKEFYVNLDEELHRQKRDSWLRTKPVCPAYLPNDDDSITTTLYLDVVDPIISKDQMYHIFSKYGACSVNLPAGKGCGYVCFEERSSAEKALSCLEYVFGNNNICDICWGIKEDGESSLMS